MAKPYKHVWGCKGGCKKKCVERHRANNKKYYEKMIKLGFPDGMSFEHYEKHRKLTKRWRARHYERHREMDTLRKRRYRAKVRAIFGVATENTEYLYQVAKFEREYGTRSNITQGKKVFGTKV